MHTIFKNQSPPEIAVSYLTHLKLLSPVPAGTHFLLYERFFFFSVVVFLILLFCFSASFWGDREPEANTGVVLHLIT